MGRIKEKKEVVKYETVTIGHKCDQCGKEVHEGDGFPDGWHEFISGHYGWGNDSIESIKQHLVCGGKCYLDRVKELIPELKQYERMGAYIDHYELVFLQEILNYGQA